MNTLKLGGDIIFSRSVIDGDIAVTAAVLDGDIKAAGGPVYRGEYEFTPSSSVQTIEIAGLTAKRNITINPVPSNYGLITWDGSVLTVS